MNTRKIPAGAAVLAACGLLLWFVQKPVVLEQSGPGAHPQWMAPGSQSTVRPAQVLEKPSAAGPTQGQAVSVPAERPPAATVPITSSVVAGAPMVRTMLPVHPAPVAELPPAPVPEDGRAELGRVHAMLRDYRTRMKENPVGSNAEIMRAVMGGNPVGARLGPPEGQELNEQGELMDRWGTPYFFHQLSATVMEVRSAGPDGRMWTADDVVSK